MAVAPMQGIIPILVTPFDADGRVDEDSLRRLIEFNLKAGVHGLGVAIGSEIFKLSDAERMQVIRCVVEQVRGRVPVVVNTGASGTDLAIAFSRAAEAAGADALMIMPPAFLPAGAAEVLEYFRAISDAVDIPIFLQDTPLPAGYADGPDRARAGAAYCGPMPACSLHQSRVAAGHAEGRGHDGVRGRNADRIRRRGRRLFH